MKFSELNDKTMVELATLGREKRQEMFNLRLQQASSQLEKPNQLRVLRRAIAKIETRMSQLKRQEGKKAA
jgi:large subunit ribosomal protein L29